MRSVTGSMSTAQLAARPEAMPQHPIEQRESRTPAALWRGATAVVGVLGVGAGGIGLFGSARSVRIGWLLPLAGVRLDLAPLGGFFAALTGAVAVLAGVYTVGYGGSYGWPAFPW